MDHVSPQIVMRIFVPLAAIAMLMLAWCWPVHADELASERVIYVTFCDVPSPWDNCITRFVSIGQVDKDAPLYEEAIKKAVTEFLEANYQPQNGMLLINRSGPMAACDDVEQTCIQGEWLTFVRNLK